MASAACSCAPCACTTTTSSRPRLPNTAPSVGHAASAPAAQRNVLSPASAPSCLWISPRRYLAPGTAPPGANHTAKLENTGEVGLLTAMPARGSRLGWRWSPGGDAIWPSIAVWNSVLSGDGSGQRPPFDEGRDSVSHSSGLGGNQLYACVPSPVRSFVGAQDGSHRPQVRLSGRLRRDDCREGRRGGRHATARRGRR